MFNSNIQYLPEIVIKLCFFFRQSPSFNKEVFVDFIGAQIKTLAFLAYIIRVYQEQVSNHASQMVKGIIGLLTLCPPEVAHSRKELIVATRHILATDLRISMSCFISTPINTIPLSHHLDKAFPGVPASHSLESFYIHNNCPFGQTEGA